jgi:hypothetical protein
MISPGRVAKGIVRRVKRPAWVALPWVAAFVLSLEQTACSVGFDSIAEIEGLRILGVKKSKPFAKPGDRVQLQLLYNDDTDAARDVQLFWISGCTNPPADLYQVCLDGLNAAFEDVDVPDLPGSDFSDDEALAMLLGELSALASQVEGQPPDGLELPEGAELPGAGVRLGVGIGDTYAVTLDPKIISSRPPPSDPKVPPYGLEFVFFAGCAGRLWFDPGGSFPLGCFDADGNALPADRFVVGYTSVYVYDGLTNHNPEILGFEWKDGGKWKALDTMDLCLADDCEPVEPDPKRPCPDDVPQVERCKDLDENQGVGCEKLEFRVTVNEDSVDEDGVLTALQGSPVAEQMWVNFHADRGKFTYDLALVNDVASGFNDDPRTKFIPPDEPGLSHVWAVARDNRGGTDWARFSVCVER